MNRTARLFATRSLVLVAMVLVAQTFVAYGWLRPVAVVGNSMAPRLVEGERLTVRPGAEPRRWDVVVVRSPEDARRLAVKRVVGLPGEEITLREGRVWVDGRPATPPRNPGPQSDVYYGALRNPVWNLGEAEWFVAGDNQMVSVDSRHWGPIPTRLIEGVVVAPR